GGGGRPPPPPPPPPRPPVMGGGGEQVLMRLVAKHADIWNNGAVSQHELGRKAGVLRQRCEEVGRDPREVEVSQQCVVVIAADEAGAREALAKATKIY